MKILFLLALLANLLFFLWQYNTGAFAQAEDDETAVVTEPKQIWLLSELDKKPSLNVAALYNPSIKTEIPLYIPEKEPNILKKENLPPLRTRTTISFVQTPVASNTPAQITEVKNVYCYKVGWFSNRAAVIHWAQQQSLGTAPLQIKENKPQIANYLVNYPPAATFADSKKNIAILQAHGIKEFFMLNSGEFKGAISLGVFKSEARAIKVKQLLIQKGIPAQVSTRYKTTLTVSARIKTEKTKTQLLATLANYVHRPHVELLSKCE